VPRNRNEVVVISWRDIPAQVNGCVGAERHQVVLPDRFQKAIDRAAKVAGKKTVHEYVAEWKRTTQPLDGDPQAAAQAEAARLEAAFPQARLRAFAAAGGWDPEVER
jgi:Virulence factor